MLPHSIQTPNYIYDKYILINCKMDFAGSLTLVLQIKITCV